MYFPQLISCIKGGRSTSADCSHPRLSKSSSSMRSRTARPTDESTRSSSRRQTRKSSNANESDVDNGKPSSRSRRRPRLPTTAGELQAVFQKFDGNGDGKLSWSELGTLMTSLGCPATDEELRVMISMADSDGDGFMDLSHFVAINTFTVTDEAPTLDDMESAFGIFDFDGNGVISPDELTRAFHSLGYSSSLEDCRSMIAGIDSNGDGDASFDEFLTMMITSSSSV